MEGYRSAIAETLKHLRGIDIASDPCIRGIIRNRRLTRPLERNKVPPCRVPTDRENQGKSVNFEK